VGLQQPHAGHHRGADEREVKPRSATKNALRGVFFCLFRHRSLRVFGVNTTSLKIFTVGKIYLFSKQKTSAKLKCPLSKGNKKTQDK
jgi:hypothetical protein